MNLVKITMFLTFRIYRKHPLPVNMEVVINKPQIHDKSINLIKEKLPNIFTKNMDIEIHKERKILIDFQKLSVTDSNCIFKHRQLIERSSNH